MSHHEFSIAAEALVDKNATVAALYLVDLTGGIEVVSTTGASKREQGDVHDEEIAINLALGQALIKMGRELRRRGNAQVREAEKAAEAKRARSEARKARKAQLAAKQSPTFPSPGE